MFAVLTRSTLRHSPRILCTAGPSAGMATGPRKPPGEQAMVDKDQPSLAPDPTPPPVHPEAPDAPPIPSPASLSLDFSPESPADKDDLRQDRERTGARSSKDSLSSIEKKRRALSRLALGMFGAMLVGHVVYWGREWDEDELKEKKMRIEDAPSTRWGRTSSRFWSLFSYFSEPIWPELLPPPLPPPHQKPYTLLLSVDDLLVTSTWDRTYGWRTAKRPGVDYFIAYLSQFFEVVVFTTQHSYTAAPIIERLDPYNFFINYKLFREATRSLDGKVVKDLSYLNRDLSKVVLLDTHPEHAASHPENAIIIPKWNGDPRDRGLIAIIPFLESIGIYKPADVRPILQAYADKDIPLEYAKKEREAKERHIEEWKASGKGKIASGGFTLSRLFSGSDAPPIPPTYLEQKRAEAQAQYREEQAYIAAHKDEFEALLEQDRQAMAKEMSGSLWSTLDAFSGKKPGEAGGSGAANGSPQAGGAQPEKAS